MAGITLLSWFEERDPEVGNVQEAVVRLLDGTIVLMSEICGTYELSVAASRPDLDRGTIGVIWDFVAMNSSTFSCDKDKSLRKPAISLWDDDLGPREPEHDVYFGSSEALFEPQPDA